MARKIKEFPAEGAGAAIAEPVKAAEADTQTTVVQPREWLPMKFHADGEPDTSCLEPAKFVEKTRVINLIGGGQHAEKQIKFVKAGDARYSVSPAGELIAWYRKRGGIGRKLIRQFRKQFPDTKEGKERRRKETSFRALLRSKGVPGA